MTRKKPQRAKARALKPKEGPPPPLVIRFGADYAEAMGVDLAPARRLADLKPREREILRALAVGPLQGKAIADAIARTPGQSGVTAKDLERPLASLVRAGLIASERGLGYLLTAKGRGVVRRG